MDKKLNARGEEPAAEERRERSQDKKTLVIPVLPSYLFWFKFGLVRKPACCVMNPDKMRRVNIKHK